MNTQKWIGSIPIFWATGASSGARMTMLGVVSMNMPAMMKITSMIAISAFRSAVSDVSARDQRLRHVEHRQRLRKKDRDGNDRQNDTVHAG